MTNKFILNLAPTGMVPTKEITPYVPVSPSEIIEQILAGIDAGANIVHLHARESESGIPTYKKEIYSEIIAGIREKNISIPICVSTSGRNYNELSKRSEVLELSNPDKPDFASLTLGSLNFINQASVNPPDVIKALLKKMIENDIRPEFEAFDSGMINYSKYLIQKTNLKPPYYFNLILGNIATAQADMSTLSTMINALPEGSIWAVGGIGTHQLNMNMLGLIAGGGMRVGLEDCIWMDTKRKKLASNIDLIKRVVGLADMLGYTPYTPEEVRKLVME